MRHFDTNLNGLRDSITAMASLAEEMIDRSIQAMNVPDPDIANQVRELDRRMDAWELQLDHFCIELLALQAPAAVDLRFVASSLKIVPELERIGDHCCNIARRGTLVHPPVLLDGSLERLGQETRSMVSRAMNAFVTKDAALARAVILADDSVDELYAGIYRELIRLMKADPGCIDRAGHLILVIKNWERIADQATNIAEEVLYILEAQSAKHPYLQGKGPAPGEGRS
jgi:phosphate transport system protein